MSNKSRPVVLVHGLWDTPHLFNKLKNRLEEFELSVFAPHLPHNYGRISISVLAQDLQLHIEKQFGKDVVIDLVGFSMGGLIGRVWLQEMHGAERTSRFISVGSPHKGTFTAQLVPSWFLAGVAEMKRSSIFLNELNSDFLALNEVECISFFCVLDLMVFPGWEAVLPVGSAFRLPVLTHKALMNNSVAIDRIVGKILRRDI
tara:strand:+ start:148 stop:753 length:606 start_codon:yes stop_codon:yes gene_type:complete